MFIATPESLAESSVVKELLQIPQGPHLHWEAMPVDRESSGPDWGKPDALQARSNQEQPGDDLMSVELSGAYLGKGNPSGMSVPGCKGL